MEKKIYLLTTKTCTYCPMVKSMIEDKGLDIEYVDVEENPEVAMEVMVMSVPTIIDNRNDDLLTHVGQQASMKFVGEQ